MLCDCSPLVVVRCLLFVSCQCTFSCLLLLRVVVCCRSLLVCVGYCVLFSVDCRLLLCVVVCCGL